MTVLVEYLRAQLALPRGQGRISRADLAELVDAADTLRAYAQHPATCGHFTQQRPYGAAMLPGPCTCGLQAALGGAFVEPEGWAARGMR